MIIVEWIASLFGGSFLKKGLPILLVLGALGGGIWWATSYIRTMKEQIDSNKEIIAALKTQNDQIKAANETLAADMKSVKELTDAFNTQLVTIRANANALSNVVNSSKFKTQVTSNVKESQVQLNKSFNDYFDKLNASTNEKVKK